MSVKESWFREQMHYKPYAPEDKGEAFLGFSTDLGLGKFSRIGSFFFAVELESLESESELEPELDEGLVFTTILRLLREEPSELETLDSELLLDAEGATGLNIKSC
jgi:hypothetical protein